MAGILGQQMRQEPQQQGPQKQVMQPMMIAAMRFLHKPQMTARFIQIMKSINDPATAIAKAAVLAMQTIRSQAKGLPPEAVIPAFQGIIVMLGEIADTAKLFKVDKAVLKQAFDMIMQNVKQYAESQSAPSAQRQPILRPQPAQQPAMGG